VVDVEESYGMIVVCLHGAVSTVFLGAARHRQGRFAPPTLDGNRMPTYAVLVDLPRRNQTLLSTLIRISDCVSDRCLEV
jgi:hypothetical protein